MGDDQLSDDLRDHVRSVVDYFEIPLEGPIYDDVYGKLFIEVRDFGRPERTLVIRTLLDGHPITTMVRWDTFTDALDAMRGRMMSEDWDDALAKLTGGNLDTDQDY